MPTRPAKLSADHWTNDLWDTGTPLGWISTIQSDVGTVWLTFGHHDAANAEQSAALFLATQRCAARLPRESHDLLRERLQAYAEGLPVPLDDLPLDHLHRTPFQLRVLRACHQIPRGATTTYQQLAVRVGSPGAARAIGNVMAGNRLPLLVPCHRVVGAQGALGGFSAPSGLDMKRFLLKLEASEAPGDMVGDRRLVAV